MKEQNTNTAIELLKWNKKNLISKANLQKEEIANFFADNFLVKANGNTYDGNYDNYFEFLNAFRETIDTIDYDLEEFVSNENKVVIPLKAKIIRTNGDMHIFDAILILGFNESGKINLWQEVYMEFMKL